MRRRAYTKHHILMALIILVIGALTMSTVFAGEGSPATSNDPVNRIQSYDAHSIVIASDRHENETAMMEAMKGSDGISSDVEYVSIIGDLVGTRIDEAPAFASQTILDEVRALGFKAQTRENISILWADHDENVNDDAGIVFGGGGRGSGLMKTGYNADGTPAYYVYGIAFYDMSTRSEAVSPEEVRTRAQAEAKKFETWVDKEADPSVPIIVLCHIPMHYAREDNMGATYWNRALNYAATGSESTAAGQPIYRDVIFLHGHNHTVESGSSRGQTAAEEAYTGEFFVPRGSRMEVGASDGVWSSIYYTYTTAGYLNKNKTATLIRMNADTLTLVKYREGSVPKGPYYDTVSRKSGAFASRFVTDPTNTILRAQARLDNGMKVKATKKTLRYSKLKKTKKTLRPLKVTGAKGTLRYLKTSGSKKLTVNKTTGKVTVKKGTRKGTYKVGIRVTASGDETHKPQTRSVKAVIRVK